MQCSALVSSTGPESILGNIYSHASATYLRASACAWALVATRYHVASVLCKGLRSRRSAEAGVGQ